MGGWKLLQHLQRHGLAVLVTIKNKRNIYIYFFKEIETKKWTAREWIDYFFPEMFIWRETKRSHPYWGLKAGMACFSSSFNFTRMLCKTESWGFSQVLKLFLSLFYFYLLHMWGNLEIFRLCLEVVREVAVCIVVGVEQGAGLELQEWSLRVDPATTSYLTCREPISVTSPLPPGKWE